MKKELVILIILIATLNSCTIKLQSKRIKLNDQKDIYEYCVTKKHSYPLRHASKELVDSSNYTLFMDELDKSRNKYPIHKRNEHFDLQKKSDFQLVLLYQKANQYIIENEFDKSINELTKIERKYPEIVYYSDYYFLKGLSFKNLGMNDSATVNYNKFLKYSGQKYSKRFRGYWSYDRKDTSYIKERIIAKSFVNNNECNLQPDIIPIKPKYYYGSFQPGYSFNSGDNPAHSLGTFMFIFSNDLCDEVGIGAQFYLRVNDFLSINPKIINSPNSMEMSIGTPLQVVKTENNNFGLKITPYFEYLKIDSIKFEEAKYPLNDNFINCGVRISEGYYFMQNLSLGAYYQYSYYNKNNTYVAKDNFVIWKDNEYDVSFYYNVFKDISIKSGIKNDDAVAGLFISGWEISYNISNPGILLKVDMY